MKELMRQGKYCQIYFNTETNRYEINTPDGILTYGIKIKAINFFKEIENKYRIINK